MRLGAALCVAFLLACSSHRSGSFPAKTETARIATPAGNSGNPNGSYTYVALHNVVLDEQSGLQLRVRWLRGRMFPTKPGVPPSFDDPNSFLLVIDEGIVAADLASLSGITKSKATASAGLTDLKIAPEGNRLKITGTVHKGVPLPVQIMGSVSAAPDGRVRVHVDKISILKVPVKGVLKTFDLKTADLFDPKGSSGIEVKDDDIFLDPEQILPPPKKRGKVTDVHVGRNGDLVEIYGNARNDVITVKEWRNFMRLRGGTINFGKITMDNADLFLIDMSQDDWFEFDLGNYQQQLVNGFARMTPQAGLRFFMPDITKIPKTESNRQIGIEWLKHRSETPPADPP